MVASLYTQARTSLTGEIQCVLGLAALWLSVVFSDLAVVRGPSFRLCYNATAAEGVNDGTTRLAAIPLLSNEWIGTTNSLKL